MDAVRKNKQPRNHYQLAKAENVPHLPSPQVLAAAAGRSQINNSEAAPRTTPASFNTAHRHPKSISLLPSVREEETSSRTHRDKALDQYDFSFDIKTQTKRLVRTSDNPTELASKNGFSFELGRSTVFHLQPTWFERHQTQRRFYSSFPHPEYHQSRYLSSQAQEQVHQDNEVKQERGGGEEEEEAPISFIARKSQVRRCIEAVEELQKEVVQLEKSSYQHLVKEESDAKAASNVVKESLMTRMSRKQYWVDLWAAIKHEFHHYKAGFKLLWTDLRIARRLLWKTMNGVTLSRRERRQFTRTVADLFRVLPFSAFIIIPAGELFLPFFIKFFPSMLPTQFRDPDTEYKKGRGQLRIKLEMAKFLQETIDQMALERKGQSEEQGKSLSELAALFEEGRANAKDIPVAELLKFSKLFTNVLTLDALSYAQLVALCRLLQLPTLGSSEILNFQLTMKLRELKADDMMIMKEGVDSLSVNELQEACTARGMRALGISEEQLRLRLQQWLQLHVVEEVPTSLLLLSRVMYLPEKLSPATQLATVLDGLPENIKDEVRLQAARNEAKRVTPEDILVVLENEEQRIAEEIEAEKRAEILALEQEKLKAHLKLLKLAQSEMLTRQPGSEFEVWDQYSEIMRKKQAIEQQPEAIPKKKKEDEDDSPFTRDELRECLTYILEENIELEYFQTLKGEILDRKDDFDILEDLNLKASPGTKLLMTRVSKMVDEMESSLEQTLKLPHGTINLDSNGDGIVSTEELVLAFKQLPWPDGARPKSKRLRKMASSLDADGDGTVKVITLQKIFSLATSEKGNLDFHALKTVVEMVAKEELVDSGNTEATKKVTNYDYDSNDDDDD